jgi:hypothetical protein
MQIAHREETRGHFLVSSNFGNDKWSREHW